MEKEMTADQILAALWRRRKLVGLVALLAFAVGVAIVFALPKSYKASSVVRVSSPRPTEDLVPRTVGDTVEQRLLTVRQELMGRPVLQKVIAELNLYPEEIKKKGIDGAVEEMRHDLEVKVEGDSAFELNYLHSDPQTAAKVANRLPQVFAEQTLKHRQVQAQLATQLFSGEADLLKDSLATAERKIAQFKVDHTGELPEQLEVNMRALERLGSEMRNRSDELRVADARRSDMVFARHSVDSEAGRLEAAASTLARELVAAQTTLTPDHPDLQRMKKELGSLQRQRQEAEGRLVAERQERIRASNRVAQIERAIDGLQREAQSYQGRLERTPRWAEELSVLQRDYDITKEKYRSVISRKVEAELAQQLEASSASTIFNVLSPAGVPTTPARPDRTTGLIIALLAALGLGALAGAFVEMRDDSIRDAHQIREQLPIPILAVVPLINGKSERRVLTPAGRTALPPEPAALN
jgi:polysaccharide chain length determinant protein (PEP-CTERM system associated)